MINQTKLIRQNEIEQAAYELLDEYGYEGISMLKIAKRAKASNETLYKWYGDKRGLFSQLVKNNSQNVQDFLESEIDLQQISHDMLLPLGIKLLSLLLSPRAIALNRAAAGDASGKLGQQLAASGRKTIMPLIVTIFDHIAQENKLTGSPNDLAELYLRLLVGDWQIRRVTGAMDEISSIEMSNRADQTKNLIMLNLLAQVACDD